MAAVYRSEKQKNKRFDPLTALACYSGQVLDGFIEEIDEGLWRARNAEGEPVGGIHRNMNAAMRSLYWEESRLGQA